MTDPIRLTQVHVPEQRRKLRWSVSSEAWALEVDVAGARVAHGTIAHALAVFAHRGDEITDRWVLTKRAESMRRHTENLMRAEMIEKLGDGVEVTFEWHPIDSSIGTVTATGVVAAHYVDAATPGGRR